MRPRHWLAWLIFGICALLVLEGLGWVTWQALRFEAREREARAESRQQEAIRLALWRMESELAPIIAQESSRPYFHYRSFYPADGAYDSMWEVEAAAREGALLVPSPLLESAGLYTRLHFQIEPDGRMTSPQVPMGRLRERALDASSLGSASLTPEILMLAEQRLAHLAMVVTAAGGNDQTKRTFRTADEAMRKSGVGIPIAQPASKPELDQAAPEQLSQNEYQARQQMAQAARDYGEATNAAAGSRGRQSNDADGESAMRLAEAGDRANAETNAGIPAPTGVATDSRSALEPVDALASATTPLEKERGAERVREPVASDALGRMVDSPTSPIQLGPLEASWVQGITGDAPELVLMRSLSMADASTTQGVWLDWPALSSRLVKLAAGLLPGSTVAPALGPVPPDQQGRLLATIPVLLEPGPAPAIAPLGLSTTRLTLGATWLAVLGAVGAIGWVLRSSMDLSDRRGRFVAAVTHELRTPLTSFCLYTEMLAGGMVPDERDRTKYLATLQGESKRLARLVENVLSFSRLSESGPAPKRSIGSLDLAAAITRMQPLLHQRAAAADMELDVEGFGGLPPVRADADTLERVLFNLVDNAAKYAHESSDRRIMVRGQHRTVAGRMPACVTIDVRDFGPGIPGDDKRRIFNAFYRSARDAESPKAGLGLGLALARGLVRQMGGELELVPADGPGALFRLTLRSAQV